MSEKEFEELEETMEQETKAVETEETKNCSCRQDLEEQLAKASQELEELNTRYLRLQADFENFKRRSKKDLETMARVGTEKLVVSILPVLDNFRRALDIEKPSEEVEGFMTGMNMIFGQINEALQKEGVTAIEAVGQPFDPEKHEAVMQVPVDTKEQDNIIVGELQIGYSLNEKVIRPSMVQVGKFQ